MAKINFPSSPTQGTQHTDANGQLWEYDGTVWVALHPIAWHYDVDGVAPSNGDGLSWDSANGWWEADGTILREADVDDTPVDAATTVPISSNWAYDHENAADPHSVYPLDTEVLKKDGSVALTANWDAGSFDITAEQFHSDIVTGTAPLTVASTTVVANLNADLLDGSEGSAYLLIANIDDVPVDAETSAPISSNWAYDHENAADPHTQYVAVAGDTMTGSLTIDKSSGVTILGISGIAGTDQALILQTALSNRWAVDSSPEAESGSNAGSNFRLLRYSDAGAAIASSLSITRSTGNAVFEADVSANTLTSSIATGTAPFTVASTTKVVNLNADWLDGINHVDFGKLGVAAEWTKGQNFNRTTLTDGATINWALQDNQVCKVTLGGNRTMAAPTQLVDGLIVQLSVIQDATGSRTITWNSVFKWAAGTAPTLTTTASASDLFTFLCDGTNLIESGRSINPS